MHAYANDCAMDTWSGIVDSLEKPIDVIEPQLCNLLRNAEMCMTKNNWCFISGNKAGPGDFCVAALYLTWLNNPTFALTPEHKAMVEKCYDACPKVKDMTCRLAKNEKLAAHLACRPARPY